MTIARVAAAAAAAAAAEALRRGTVKERHVSDDGGFPLRILGVEGMDEITCTGAVEERKDQAKGIDGVGRVCTMGVGLAVQNNGRGLSGGID